MTDGKKLLAYSGDTEWTDALYGIAKGANLFIVECYDHARDVTGHISWATLKTRKFEARRVINEGKLALVLGIETSKLFDCGEVNYVPQCDLLNPAANGECGAMSNPNFGSTFNPLTVDPEAALSDVAMATGIYPLIPHAALALTSQYHGLWRTGHSVLANAPVPVIVTDRPWNCTGPLSAFGALPIQVVSTIANASANDNDNAVLARDSRIALSDRVLQQVA